MKNTPETFVGILLAAVLGLTVVGCEKSEEAATEATESAQKTANEAVDAAKVTTERAADAAKEVGQSAIDTTTQAVRKVEAKTAEELEAAEKAGKQIEAVLQEAIGDALPAGQ